MHKEFYNALTYHPRYVRILVIITLMMIVTTVLMTVGSNSSLEQKRSQITGEEFSTLKQEQDSKTLQAIGISAAALILLPTIVFLKRKTRIVLSPEGIEYRTAFKKKFMEWNRIKDIKVLKAGSALEMCRVKSKEDEFTFNTYFLERTGKFRFEKEGIFDEHDNPVPSAITRGKLYKEIKKRMVK